MTKLISKAFTSYFGRVTPVDILSYDNNKYVQVQLPGGDTVEVKRGYLFANAELSRPIPQVNWFIHGGGSRRNYRPHVRHTSYLLWATGAQGVVRFSCKSRAVACAIALAAARQEVVPVVARRSTESRGRCSSTYGGTRIECFPNGVAMQHSGRSRVRGPKYLRGFGKVPVPLSISRPEIKHKLSGIPAKSTAIKAGVISSSSIY